MPQAHDCHLPAGRDWFRIVDSSLPSPEEPAPKISLNLQIWPVQIFRNNPMSIHISNISQCCWCPSSFYDWQAAPSGIYSVYWVPWRVCQDICERDEDAQVISGESYVILAAQCRCCMLPYCSSKWQTVVLVTKNEWPPQTQLLQVVVIVFVEDKKPEMNKFDPFVEQRWNLLREQVSWIPIEKLRLLDLGQTCLRSCLLTAALSSEASTIWQMHNNTTSQKCPRVPWLKEQQWYKDVVLAAIKADLESCIETYWHTWSLHRFVGVALLEAFFLRFWGFSTLLQWSWLCLVVKADCSSCKVSFGKCPLSHLKHSWRRRRIAQVFVGETSVTWSHGCKSLSWIQWFSMVVI